MELPGVLRDTFERNEGPRKLFSVGTTARVRGITPIAGKILDFESCSYAPVNGCPTTLVSYGVPKMEMASHSDPKIKAMDQHNPGGYA